MSISYFPPVISDIKNSVEKSNENFRSNFSSLLLLVNKSASYDNSTLNYETGECSASFVALFSEFPGGKEMQAISKMFNRVIC